MYDPTAVNQAIASSNRAGRKISKAEARKIHALMKGWRGDEEERILRRLAELDRMLTLLKL